MTLLIQSFKDLKICYNKGGFMTKKELSNYIQEELKKLEMPIDSTKYAKILSKKKKDWVE